jgi:hypothetical protein
MTDAEQMEKVLVEMSKGWKKFLESFNSFKNQEISEAAFLLQASCIIMNNTYLFTDTSDEPTDIIDHLPPALEMEVSDMLDDGAL